MRLKKASTPKWVCPGKPQCRNWQRVPCKHLESELTPPKSTSVPARLTGDVDKLVSRKKLSWTDPDFNWDNFDQFSIIYPPDDENVYYESRFRVKLKKCGLTPLHVDILTYTFVHALTLKDVGESLGITNVQTVHRLLKEGLARLKRAGFRKEVKK